jgi:hypothetical protein
MCREGCKKTKCRYFDSAAVNDVDAQETDPFECVCGLPFVLAFWVCLGVAWGGLGRRWSGWCVCVWVGGWKGRMDGCTGNTDLTFPPPFLSRSPHAMSLTHNPLQPPRVHRAVQQVRAAARQDLHVQVRGDESHRRGALPVLVCLLVCWFVCLFVFFMLHVRSLFGVVVLVE